MIAASKSRWFTAWFARHCEKRLRGAFDRVRVAGLDHLERSCREGATVVVSNHTAWWDAVVAIWLAHRVLGADAYALMNAANLRRLPFFALVGALGVDLAEPRDGALVVRHAARLCDRPGRLVWVFAQGDERPSTEPLRFRPGAPRIARLSGARVVPVALRYEQGPTERPSLWISVGEPLGEPGDVAAHERAVTSELARIDEALCSGRDAAFVTRWARGPGWLALLAESSLAWLTRWFVRIPPALSRSGAAPNRERSVGRAR